MIHNRTLLYSGNDAASSVSLTEPLSAFDRYEISVTPGFLRESTVQNNCHRRVDTPATWNTNGYIVWPTDIEISDGTSAIDVDHFQILMQNATETAARTLGLTNSANNVKRIYEVWGINRKDEASAEGLGSPGNDYTAYNETLLCSGVANSMTGDIQLSERANAFERLKVGVGTYGENINIYDVDSPVSYTAWMPLYSYWGTSTASYYFSEHRYRFSNSATVITPITGKTHQLGTAAANPYTTTGNYTATDTFIRHPLYAIWGINRKPVRTLTLLSSDHGSIASNILTGYEYDEVVLSNTPDTDYNFSAYSITGGTLTGNTFKFGKQDASAEAIFTDLPICTLTLSQKTGGTIAADKTSGFSGEVVTLSNTPASEYTFGSYSITGATLTGNQFAFGTSNVTAAGTFNQKSYTLTLQNDGHGTIDATKTTGHVGDTVTLSNTYNTYYRFNNYTVTGGTINGSTFTFGSQNATAKANFKVNSFTATGTFANYSLAPLGRNTLNYLFYPIVKAKQSNVPTSWLTTKTSYAKTISAYNTSYKTTASGSNASAFKPTGTISAYQFSGYLQTCAYSDYDTSRWHSCNYGIWAGGSKRVNGTPTTPTVAKAYFMTTTNGTTNVTGDVFWSGGLTGTRAADNITICNGVTTNKWRASGILP